MKREIFISLITSLSEIGAGALVFFLYALLTEGDFLIGLIGAVIFGGLAGLIIYIILDENLPRRKKWKKDQQKND